MGIHGNLVSFNAGELSPLMSARADISQYSSGCQKLENFLVTPYGSIMRRPGTQHLASAKFADKKCRLIPFIYSTEQNYILEFGEGYIRFFANGEPILDEVEEIYEIESPYLANLHLLKTVQSADVLFIVHPDYFPMKLSRLTQTTFELTELEIVFPPVQDPNITDITITPSGTTGDITLVASSDIFLEGHIGSYWEIVHPRVNSQLSGSFTAVGNSDPLKTFGQWNFVTRGTWAGTIQLQKSFDNGVTWIDFRSYSSDSDKNFDVTGNEKEEDVLYRVRMDVYTSGQCDYDFRNDNFYNHGAVKITDVTDGTHANATVTVELGSTDATKDWGEAAWSEVAGYPGCITFYEERLFFAGTKKQPQTLWGSKVNEWTNFKLDDLDDSALSFTVSADNVNSIFWILAQNALMFGTVAAEWKLSASTEEKPLTPSNVSIKRQSNYGSSYIQALLVGTAILYTQSQGRKVREFVYDFQKDGYVSPDLTILAEHITKPNITEAAIQRQPDTILWCIRSDGQAAALTYERDQNVVGWHRHITDGEFESVAVIPGDSDDEIYVVVKRTIDGNVVRYIERFASREWDSIESANFADCSVWKVPDEDNVVSGLEHLEGKTVCVVADGSPRTSQAVDDGKITLDAPADNVLIGLPFVSTLVPMPLEIQMQDGSSQFRVKRISQAKIRVFESIGGKVRTGEGDYEKLITREASGDVNEPIPPYSGVFTIPQSGGWTPDSYVEIVQDEPLPLTILNISPVYEVDGSS